MCLSLPKIIVLFLLLLVVVIYLLMASLTLSWTLLKIHETLVHDLLLYTIVCAFHAHRVQNLSKHMLTKRIIIF